MMFERKEALWKSISGPWEHYGTDGTDEVRNLLAEDAEAL